MKSCNLKRDNFYLKKNNAFYFFLYFFFVVFVIIDSIFSLIYGSNKLLWLRGRFCECVCYRCVCVCPSKWSKLSVSFYFLPIYDTWIFTDGLLKVCTHQFAHTQQQKNIIWNCRKYYLSIVIRSSKIKLHSGYFCVCVCVTVLIVLIKRFNTL